MKDSNKQENMYLYCNGSDTIVHLTNQLVNDYSYSFSSSIS